MSFGHFLSERIPSRQSGGDVSGTVGVPVLGSFVEGHAPSLVAVPFLPFPVHFSRGHTEREVLSPSSTKLLSNASRRNSRTPFILLGELDQVLLDELIDRRSLLLDVPLRVLQDAPSSTSTIRFVMVRTAGAPAL